ncbi:hypothetical protein GF361_03455 [Candidatus Woesearchaeota archaeon]|nr:hypothetical protein [Candidatus Woesearchaeota archaeon]
MGIFSKLVEEKKEEFIKKAKETNMRGHGEINARLFVDAEKKKILFVPHKINHPEFIAAHIGKTKEDIKKNINLINQYIPVTVEIAEEKATAVLVGISGLETWLDANKKKYNYGKDKYHNKKYVNQARDFILAVLQEYEILAPDFKLRIIYK